MELLLVRAMLLISILLFTGVSAAFDYPFAPPARAAARLDITTTSGAQPFDGRLFGANAQFATARPFGYADPRIQRLLQRIRLPQLRFPGGTVGNYYDWRADAFYNDSWARSKPGRSEAIDSGFTFAFASYASSMRSTNASSVLMFNVVEDSVDSGVARLRQRVRELPQIDRVELGNENYFADQSQGHVNPSNASGGGGVEDYIAWTKALSAALKTAVPGVQTAVPISNRGWSSDDGGWNTRVAQEADYFDAVVVHAYQSVQRPSFDTAAAATVLEASQAIAEDMDEASRHFPTKAMLLTEWGILTPKCPRKESAVWLVSLAEADQLLAILTKARDGSIGSAGKHILFAPESSNSALFTSSNGTSAGAAVLSTPSGVWYRAILEAYRGGHSLEAKVADVPSVGPGIAGIRATAVRGADGKLRVVAVSKLNVRATLSVTVDGKAGECEVRSFGPSMDAWPLFDLDAEPWSASVRCTGSNVATLPPLSVSVVTLG